jgi:hypothetical protein
MRAGQNKNKVGKSKDGGTETRSATMDAAASPDAIEPHSPGRCAIRASCGLRKYRGPFRDVFFCKKQGGRKALLRPSGKRGIMV